MSKRATFDCRKYDWQTSLEAHLKRAGEAELIHFNMDLDGKDCIEIAKRCGAEVLFDSKREADRAQIRRVSI